MQRDVDELLLAFARKSPPSRGWTLWRDENNPFLTRVCQRPEEEAFVTTAGVCEAAISPDIYNRPRRKNKEAAAVNGLTDPGSNHRLRVVSGEEAEGRLFFVLRIPGAAPGVLFGSYW